MSKYLKTIGRKTRCWWPGEDEQYIRYHDNEWGVPVKDNRRMYEKICLEGFQSGLSWLTILRKRENFREAFANFEMEKVANFGKREISKLLKNEGIIRHRGKIEATIKNAKAAIGLIEEVGSLAKFFWKFEPKPRKFDANRGVTDESKTMSKELKKRGFGFVGPTTCYSFMQSMGIVNDHHLGCFCYEKIKKIRSRFKRA